MNTVLTLNEEEILFNILDRMTEAPCGVLTRPDKSNPGRYNRRTVSMVLASMLVIFQKLKTHLSRLWQKRERITKTIISANECDIREYINLLVI